MEPSNFLPPAEGNNEITRSITLSNMQWMVISQCVEAFSSTYRGRQSETIATYVTRNQLTEAVEEAARMNEMLAYLDDIQVNLM